MSNDPAICSVCKGPMKPLFTGFYCPKDCDRPKAKAPASVNNLIDEYNKAIDAAMQPINWATIKKGSGWNSWGGSGGAFIPFNPVPPAPVKPVVIPADDACRKPFCGGKGLITHTSHTYSGDFSHYSCQTCATKWQIPIFTNGVANVQVP